MHSNSPRIHRLLYIGAPSSAGLTTCTDVRRSRFRRLPPRNSFVWVASFKGDFLLESVNGQLLKFIQHFQGLLAENIASFSFLIRSSDQRNSTGQKLLRMRNVEFELTP